MEKSDIGPVPGAKIGAVGIPWYAKADYAAALQIMADAQVLPATHAAWLIKAEEAERKLTGKGHKVFRAMIDPKTFPDWCQSRGMTNIDARARQLWGAEYAARQIGL